MMRVLKSLDDSIVDLIGFGNCYLKYGGGKVEPDPTLLYNQRTIHKLQDIFPLRRLIQWRYSFVWLVVHYF